MLEPPREIVEEYAPRSDKYSAIEGEILALLRRPAAYPQSFNELRNELTPIFSASQILERIRNLLDDGLIRVVHVRI